MSDTFEAARTAFEAMHARDPVHQEGEPASLRYHRRLSEWVLAVDPNASEALRLAAWCQHLRRWEIPRSTFPAGLVGYKKWRSTLAQFHAAEAQKVLTSCGYDEALCQRVRELLIKKGLKSDAEVQAFEDAICLVFLEQQFAAFSLEHPEEKIIDIVRKTWRKMSPKGQALAQGLLPSLEPGVRGVLVKALS